MSRRPVSAARSALTRRGFLGAVGLTGAGLALAACSGGGSTQGTAGSSGTGSGSNAAAAAANRIEFDAPEIAEVESGRPFSGTVVDLTMAAAVGTFALAGRQVQAMGYDAAPIGPEIRAWVGDELAVTHTNALDADTIIHWHGIQIRNDMDGAPPLTGDAVTPGGSYDYRFRLAHPGTYWYHSHVGLQADEAMLGALIVEDPADPYGADVDHVIVLDDWVKDFGASPTEILAALNPALGGHAGHSMHGDSAGSGSSGAASTSPTTAMGAPQAALDLVAGPYAQSDVLGGMTQHIAYPLHLINGHPTAEAEPITVPPQSTVRLRVINAAAETPYRFSVGGRTMTVIETDGFPCEPVEATSVLIGMAQRMDLLVTLDSGAWPFVARVEGTDTYVATELRTEDHAGGLDLGGVGTIGELDTTPVWDATLAATAASRLPDREPDRTYKVDLIQSTDNYVWGIAGPDVGKITMRMGERIRIEMTNTTDMWHPMHLHGHTFGVPEYGGLRRDTVNILPGQTLAFEFDADNPGGWMFHCHNAYHLDAGMTTNFYYER